jgi:VRR-NUC domain
LARPGRLLFVEVKSRSGRLGPDQQAWISTLTAAGAEVHVWQEGSTTLQDVADILTHRVGGAVSADGAR